jgi:hypothetical protein
MFSRTQTVPYDHGHAELSTNEKTSMSIEKMLGGSKQIGGVRGGIFTLDVMPSSHVAKHYHAESIVDNENRILAMISCGVT